MRMHLQNGENFGFIEVVFNSCKVCLPFCRLYGGIQCDSNGLIDITMLHCHYKNGYLIYFLA
jgi:hypothetical protein